MRIRRKWLAAWLAAALGLQALAAPASVCGAALARYAEITGADGTVRSCLSLSDYLEQDIHTFVRENPAFSITGESQEEIKAKTDSVSVTATGNGAIVRIRLDSGAVSYCAENTSPRMDLGLAQKTLREAGYAEAGTSEDGSWLVYENQSSRRFAAFSCSGAEVQRIYCGIQGYMPFRINRSAGAAGEARNIAQGSDLSLYLGAFLKDAKKNYPDLKEDSSLRYYTSYVSPSKGVSFSVITEQTYLPERLNNMIFGVSADGTDRAQKVWGFDCSMSEDQLRDGIARQGLWQSASPGGETYRDPAGNTLGYYSTDRGLMLFGSLSPYAYKAYPAGVTDKYDLAGYMGRTLNDVKAVFPEMTITSTENGKVGLLDGGYVGIDDPIGSEASDSITYVQLEKRKSLFTIYGVSGDMSGGTIEAVLGNKGMFYDGGSGEYSDADDNIFDTYSLRLLKPDW